MENLDLYNKIRVVPKDAQKTINGGRLNGKTDINPMWRLKMLTEQFGICGFGWKYVITSQWIEKGANNEISAFVNIDLFVKMNGEWSDAIVGTGGSSFVANEKNGLYTSDECYKMALTDAISVACKALGMGADVYWSADNTKYITNKPSQPIQTKQPTVQTNQNDTDLIVAINSAKKANTVEDLQVIWNSYGGYQKNQQFLSEVGKRKLELTNKTA